MEIKTEDAYKDFTNDKEMFDFSKYSTKSKCYDNSNKLVVGKMEDDTAGVAIEEFVRLKPNMYSYFVDGNRKHKKAKDVNKNDVAARSYNEYKHVLLNEKYLRHSINSIQSKDHIIGTYKISKITLSCFGDKIYIENNGCGGLALGY